MRQLPCSDYDECDLLIGMDLSKMQNLRRICGGDVGGKTRLLTEYTDRPGDVADPWNTGQGALIMMEHQRSWYKQGAALLK